MDVFAECRERVSAEEAARLYGIEVRQGKALCPFHNDHRPSMSFRNGYFRCWSCGASGSVVDFTARLYSLNPLEAVRKLNGDFNLALPLDRPQTAEEREEVKRQKEIGETEKLFQEWRTGLLTRLCAAIRTANDVLRRGEPFEAWTEQETQAVRNSAALEYYVDLLEGDLAQQMEVFRVRRGVEKLCRRVLNSMPTKSGAA